MRPRDVTLTPDHDDLAVQVSGCIERGEVQPVLDLIVDLHPADIAEIMERLDRLEQTFLFDALDPEVASDVLPELEHPTREDVLEDIDEQRIAPIVDEMDSDDAADILGELDEEERKRVLLQVSEESRAEVEQLLVYPEDSAGGIMALEVPWVRGDHTVAKAVEMVRIHHREMEEINEIFVVDAEHRLEGTVLPVELLLADPASPVAEIMDSETVSVRPEEDQEEAANLATKYDLLAVPVTDANRKLIGVITYDDIFDVMEEEEQEDISFMAGTGEDEPAERSALKAVRERGPWLLLGLGGSIAAARVMEGFEKPLAANLVMAFFVPAIMATAGSVAIQSSSLVVRGISTGALAFQGMPKILWRELRISLLMGLGLGLLLGLYAFLFYGDGRFGVALVTALGLVVVNASLSGATIPLVLRKVGIDPAVAMGPFITTLNDVMGIVIYFVVIVTLLG